jgi:tRNA threonylcarbamoyladenosine biosynthesis protein TsaE|tara:strand:- start:652 stop:1116 length:465 start_codon:yes stop_codon:yes gene_type:complete
MNERLVSQSEDETADVAADLARRLDPGAVVLLYGQLGAGKTAFVRGFVRGRGVARDEVSSPTFTLIQEYGGGAVYHVDLYRLQPAEVDDLGLEELPESGGLLCIEWADRLPRPFRGAVSVRITDQGRDVREIVITDESPPAPADDHPVSSASRT